VRRSLATAGVDAVPDPAKANRTALHERPSPAHGEAQARTSRWRRPCRFIVPMNIDGALDALRPLYALYFLRDFRERGTRTFHSNGLDPYGSTRARGGKIRSSTWAARKDEAGGDEIRVVR